MKLKEKIRIGGKVKKIYDTPKTPYLRLIESGHLTDLQTQNLEQNFALLNPFELRQGLDQKLSLYNKMLSKHSNLIHEGEIPEAS